jgi:hypothetical protein
MWNRLRCVFGRHHRDRHGALKGRSLMWSRCEHCGVAMIKDAKGWRRAGPDDPQPGTG